MSNAPASDSRSHEWSRALPSITVTKIESIMVDKDRIAFELERVAGEARGATARRLRATRRQLKAAATLDDIINDPDTLAVCWHVNRGNQAVPSLDTEQIADSIRRGVETFRDHTDSRRLLGPMLAYPYVLFVIAFAMCVLASFYIVNDIDQMYQEFQLDLPGISRLFFGLAGSVRRWWIVGAALLGLLGLWLFASSITTPRLPSWIRVLMIRNLGLRQAWSQWAWHIGWLLKLGVIPSDAVLIAGANSEQKWLRENSRRWSTRMSDGNWEFPSRPRSHWAPYGLLAHAFTLPTADDQAAVLHAYVLINRERSFQLNLWWLSWAPPVMMFFVVLMIGLFVFAVYAPMFDLYWWVF